jgi:hypothetical protein
MAMNNLQGKSLPLVFIDFDGVFCDSLPECYSSSWDAFHRLHRGNLPSFIDLADRAAFDSYRPFIRRGGDYVVLQHCVTEGVPLRSQQDFDRVASSMGGLVDTFHSLFYDARRDLMAADRDLYFSMNHLFGGFEKPALEWARDESCYVLSTKEADFIHGILLGKGIDWPLERLICSGKESKIGIIEAVMRDRGAAGAMLFEDQIDHLQKITDPRIKGFLASWGYIKPEWLNQREIPVISREEMVSLIARRREIPAFQP